MDCLHRGAASFSTLSVNTVQDRAGCAKYPTMTYFRWDKHKKCRCRTVARLPTRENGLNRPYPAIDIARRALTRRSNSERKAKSSHMRAAPGLQPVPPAFDVLMRGRLGYAELRRNFGVRATDRDQTGSLNLALCHAGGWQRVFHNFSKGPDTSEQTFADQAKIGALRRVELIAGADHGDEPEALAAARDGHSQAPAPSVFRRSAQCLAVQARESPVADDVAERKRLAMESQRVDDRVLLNEPRFHIIIYP